MGMLQRCIVPYHSAYLVWTQVAPEERRESMPPWKHSVCHHREHKISWGNTCHRCCFRLHKATGPVCRFWATNPWANNPAELHVSQWHHFWTLNLSDVRMWAVPSLWGTTDLFGTTFSSQRMNRASKKSHLDSGWQWVATSFRLSRLMSTHVNSTCICQLTPWAMQDFNQKSALCNCHSMFFHAIP